MDTSVRTAAAIVLWLFLAAWPTFALAQSGGDGLAEGPFSPNRFQQIEKVDTDCERCAEHEAALHAQVDVYDAARSAYEAQAEVVRERAGTYLNARADYTSLNQEYERLAAEADDLLYNRGDRSLSDYYAARDARDEVEPEVNAARKALDAARAELDAALKRLEELRLDALAEMRQAIRLQAAMFRCEFTCDLDELEADGPDVAIPSPGPVIAPSDIPTPEDFIGIVAACAKCQPHAEQVNTIRSHRRSFASDARSLHEMMTANQATLARLDHEAVVLEQEARDLYRELLSSFIAQGPGEDASQLDQTFDAREQAEAEQRLRDLAERRNRNALDRAGLAQTIAEQMQALLTALANYHAHTLLLEAAQQQLAECERTCDHVDRGGRGDPFLDPNFPEPESFGPIAAACAKCQPIADELAKTLSERYRVADDIQSEVWLLKGRRELLARWEARNSELRKEELSLGEQLLLGDKDEAAERAILARLFEIEDERTQLQIDIMWAEDEIARLEQQLAGHLAEHETLTDRAAELRQRLAECEETCHEDEDGDATGMGEGFYDPDYPRPISFLGVIAECAPCQPLADQLTDLLRERYMVASDTQDTVFRLNYNRPLLEQRRATLAELRAREEALNEEWLTTADAARRAEIDKELGQIDLDSRVPEADVAALEELNAADEALLNELMVKHDALNQQIAGMEARLAECERTYCKAGEDGTAVAVPGEDRFVSTDCAPCEPLVSLLNDVIGTLINAERNLAAAKEAFAAHHAEARARQEALDALGAREAALNEEWLTSADEARQAEIDQELHDLDGERNRIEDAREGEDQQRRKDLEAIDEAQALVDELAQQETELRVRLAECEKQCAPGTEQQTGVDVPESPFVSTDCEPCEPIVSLLNDVIGSIMTLEDDLTEAQSRLEELRGRIAEKKVAKAEAEATFAAAMIEKSRLEAAGADASAQADIIEENVDRAADLLSEIEELELDELGLSEDAEARQARLVELKKQEKDLRAQLEECEKQCAPGTEQQTGVDVPESPFVSTDCEPCEPIVSLLNDVIGSIMTLEDDLTEAQSRLEELRGRIAEKKVAKAEAEATFAAAMIEKSRLEAAGADASAQADIIEENVDRAADLLSEIEELELDELGLSEDAEARQARLAELKKQEKDLRAQLEECEKQCAPGTEQQTGVDVPESPFVSTDCEPCEPIVSLLNDVIGSIMTLEDDLTEAQSRLEELRGRIAEKKVAKAEAEATFAAAMIEKSRLEAAGADASAQADIIEENVDRAADLLSEIEELELDELGLSEDAEARQARLAELKKQEKDLRAQLEECEKQCAPGTEQQTGVDRDEADEAISTGQAPNFDLSKLQPESCRGGQSCTFEVSATNRAGEPFRGPLFLTEFGRVATGSNGEAFGEWHCSPARTGTSICVITAHAAPGQALTFRVRINLPRRVGRGAENCVEITIATDTRVLVQMIQVGLAARGFEPGTADGIAGPRTSAAIDAFQEASSLEFDRSDMSAVYMALFGTTPSPAIAGDSGRACVPMRIERPQTTPEPEPRDEPSEEGPSIEFRIRPEPDDRRRHDQDDRWRDRDDDRPGIRIEIPGLGGVGF